MACNGPGRLSDASVAKLETALAMAISHIKYKKRSAANAVGDDHDNAHERAELGMIFLPV